MLTGGNAISTGGNATRRWTAAHLASLALVLAVLVYACRGQWFFGDEWDFIVSRGLRHARWGLWRPHNEHWSTLPILWWRATNAVFGLRSYWPYLAGLFALHLLVVHCAWRLMRRAGVGAALATGVALVLGLFGAGAENMSWAFQVGFVGSLAAGLVLLLLVDGPGDRRRLAIVAAGAALSLMLSGISVVMVGAVGLAALARWGWRKAAIATVPAAVVYLLWLQLFGRVGLEGGTSVYRGSLGDMPRYVWGGMATTLGAPFRNVRVGEALLVVLLAAVALRAQDWWRRAPTLFALAAACPVMFAVISQGRGAIQNPSAGRYVYLTAGMLLPLVGFAVQQLTGLTRPRVALALAACVALSAVGVDQLRDNTAYDRARELALKGQMLGALRVAETDVIVSDRPDYTFAGDVTVADLKRLRARGELPAYTPTDVDVARARLALDVAITSRRGPRAPCRAVDLAGSNGVIVGTGTEPVIVSITPSTRGEARFFVPYGAEHAGPRTVALDAGTRVTVYSSLPRLVVQLPAGPSTVCGSAWTTP